MLRGINVGGNRKLSMPDLVAAFRGAGCAEVATYIQSGNVVFAPPPTVKSDTVGERLEQAVAEVAGFPVSVIVRTADELGAVLDASPFPDNDPTKLHVAFLGCEPSSAELDAFGRAAVAPEAFAPAGRQLYLHLPDGMGRAKLPQALGRLKTPVTVRNWRTVTKLYEMAQG
jgi:uncharacterized protein (DUF1697 family)